MVGNIVDVGWATIKSGCLPIPAYQSLTKIVRCRDEIMRRDEIRWFDGTFLYSHKYHKIVNYLIF